MGGKPETALPTASVVNLASSDSEERPCLTPWMDSLPMTEYASMEQRLHDEIVAYMTYITPTPQESIARQKVIHCVGELIKARFSHMKPRVNPFGSVAQDLCLPESDIDLVLSLPNTRPHSLVSLLFQCSKFLESAQLTYHAQVNHWASVPILKFETIKELGSFDIDISVNQTDGLSLTPVIEKYLSTFPALRPLVLVLKGFLTERGLHSAATSGLSSYALICMTISFIQQNPGKRSRQFYDQYRESESLGILLMDFLSYYGETFPYKTHYISSTKGEIRPKEDANWIKNKKANLFAIQCLVRPDNDVGKSATRIESVREAFRDTWKALSECPIASNNFRMVIKLPPSTLRHREHIKHIVDSGSLVAKTRATLQARHQSSPTTIRRSNFRR